MNPISSRWRVPPAKGSKRTPRLAIGTRSLFMLGPILPITAAALVLLLLVRSGTGIMDAAWRQFDGSATAPPSRPAAALSAPVSDEVEPVWRVEPAAGPSPPSAPVGTREPASVTGRLVELDALQALANELAQQRARLAERERAIAMREAAVAVGEERLNAQIAELRALKADTQRLLEEVAAVDTAQLKQAARVYEMMKAKRAAVVFDQMQLEQLVPIARNIRDAKLAAIVAEMDPSKARELVSALAKPHSLPPLR